MPDWLNVIPDEEGIETARRTRKESAFISSLNVIPDEEGIETAGDHVTRADEIAIELNVIPDEEGIETGTDASITRRLAAR